MKLGLGIHLLAQKLAVASKLMVLVPKITASHAPGMLKFGYVTVNTVI